MRKRFVSVILICLSVLAILSLIGYRNSFKEVSNDKVFENTMEEKIYNIANPKDNKIALSSNPYDYINAESSKEDYKYIVSQGEKSLNYMLNKFSNSNKNGLEEYIMAIACSEILKENPDSKNWASGREWYENYIKRNK